ncbi:MAG: hypothetical protein AB7E77_01800 [Desulfobulbus sp.]
MEQEGIVQEHQCADEPMAERARFERWAKEQGFHLSRGIHRDYENSKLNWMWLAWQEACAARGATLP